jgi:hypothetical protein
VSIMPVTAVDRIVAGTAQKMNRRRFLRRTGGVALAAAYGTALFGEVPAWADQLACNDSVAICNSTRCAPGGYCHDTSQTRPGGYDHFDCNYKNWPTQCWTEGHSCTWRCCDCCVDYNTGTGLCVSCSSYWACTCRDILHCP